MAQKIIGREREIKEIESLYKVEKPVDFDPFGQTEFDPFGYNMIDPFGQNSIDHQVLLL